MTLGTRLCFHKGREGIHSLSGGDQFRQLQGLLRDLLLEHEYVPTSSLSVPCSPEVFG